MRPSRLRKTLRQTTRRRRSAFYVLSQAHEPDEEFVDPYARRYEETVAALHRVAHTRHWVDATQLELWTVADTRGTPSTYMPRKSTG